MRGFLSGRRRWVLISSSVLVLGLAVWITTVVTARPATEVELKLEEMLGDIRQQERNETKPFVWAHALNSWPRPFPKLAEAILGDTDYVSGYEIAELGDEVVPRLMEAVTDDRSPRVRSSAIEVLTILEAYEAVPVITNALLRDRDADVRVVAAGAFDWRLQDERAASALSLALAGDSEEQVRVAAAQSLGQQVEAIAAGPLREALANDTSELVRVGAAGAMRGAAQPESLIALVRAVEQDSSVQVRRAAVESLGGAILPEVAEPPQQPKAEAARSAVLSVVRRAMTLDADANVRGEAAGSLAALLEDSAAGELVEAFRAEPDTPARVRMVAALADLKASEARTTFLAALEKDPEYRVRLEAANTLQYRQATWAMPVLTTVLAEDRDARVRRAAADTLSEIGGPAIAASLMQALRSESDAEARRAVAGALGSSESREALPLLTTILTARDADKQLRAKAAEALGELGFSEALLPLIATLEEVSEGLSLPEPAQVGLSVDDSMMGTRPVNRYAFDSLRSSIEEAVDQILAGLFRRRLCQASDPEAERIVEEAKARLLTILNGDYDPDARAAAARSLGYCGGDTVLAALVARTESDQSNAMVNGAVEGLGRLGDPGAVAAIAEVLGRDAELNLAALRTVMRLGRPETAPLVLPYLGSEVPEERAAAAQALGQLGNREHGARLIEMLQDDRRPEVRAAAAIALGFLGDAQAVPALISGLKDRPDTVREPAAWALGHVGSRDAIPALVEALKDDRSRAGFVASLALVEVGDPQVIPALVAQLTNKDSFNQLGAALSLAFFGDDSGIERLESALAEPGADWRSYAAVLGLVRLNTEGAREVLAGLDADGSTAFGRLIARVRVESGVAAFVPCLVEDDRDYRLYTVHALRLFDAPDCIDALGAVLNDPDEEIRDIARLTHRRLQRRHAAP